MYDAISLAVKCALYNLKIPRVNSAILDGGNIDLVLSDDPKDCDRLDVESVPIIITISKIGDFCIVDPTIDEEMCSASSVIVGVSDQKITTFKTINGGSFHTDTLDNCMDLALNIVKIVNEKLMIALKVEEEKNESTRSAKCSFLN
jgi:exosome complex component RRP42